MTRKLLLILLAFLAARMARKATRREAEVISLLWTLIQVTAGTNTANTAKARSTENRLNAAATRLPNPQPSPGGATNNSYGWNTTTTDATNNSYGPSNSSYQVSNSSYDIGSPSTDAADNNGVTSGQIGGAAAHYHAMAHAHGMSGISGAFNTLRDSYSDGVPAFNTHISDHGQLVNTVSALRSDHSNLLDDHNTLRGDHENLKTAYNVLRTDHSNLLSLHNSLTSTLVATRVIH